MSQLLGFSTDPLINKPLVGYLRRDVFGRLYIDACATDAEHIIKKPEPGEERLRCRKYIEDLFPTSFDNQRIEMIVNIGIVILPKDSAQTNEDGP